MAAPRKRHKESRAKSTTERAIGLRFRESSTRLAKIGKAFYSRGWVFGTSGNLSAVVNNEPLRLAITPSGLDKGALAPGQFVEIDERGGVLRGEANPSNETGIHLAIVHCRGARSVLHTHSIWSTIVSDVFAPVGGIFLEGFEMLKGLHGVRTHEHREWLPILENLQNIPRLSESVELTLQKNPEIHGFLLRRHGLYTWGSNIDEAKRHVEILEFLLEIQGRSHNRTPAVTQAG